MRVLLSQINVTIGDIKNNCNIIQQKILEAIQAKCDVILFPELATVGYPPRDLLYSTRFWEDEAKSVDKIQQFILNQNYQITAIVGGLHQEQLSGGRYARYNAAWILDRHFGKRVIHKRLLPCYDVFDETRYFTSAADEPYSPIPICINQNGFNRFARSDVLICEDIWNNEHS